MQVLNRTLLQKNEKWPATGLPVRPSAAARKPPYLSYFFKNAQVDLVRGRTLDVLSTVSTHQAGNRKR